MLVLFFVFLKYRVLRTSETLITVSKTQSLKNGYQLPVYYGIPRGTKDNNNKYWENIWYKIYGSKDTLFKNTLFILQKIQHYNYVNASKNTILYFRGLLIQIKYPLEHNSMHSNYLE